MEGGLQNVRNHLQCKNGTPTSVRQAHTRGVGVGMGGPFSLVPCDSAPSWVLTHLPNPPTSAAPSSAAPSTHQRRHQVDDRDGNHHGLVLAQGLTGDAAHGGAGPAVEDARRKRGSCSAPSPRCHTSGTPSAARSPRGSAGPHAASRHPTVLPCTRPFVRARSPEPGGHRQKDSKPPGRRHVGKEDVGAQRRAAHVRCAAALPHQYQQHHLLQHKQAAAEHQGPVQLKAAAARGGERGGGAGTKAVDAGTGARALGGRPSSPSVSLPCEFVNTPSLSFWHSHAAQALAPAQASPPNVRRTRGCARSGGGGRRRAPRKTAASTARREAPHRPSTNRRGPP